MFLGYQQGKIKFYTQTPLDKALYNLEKVVETSDEYVLDGDEYVLKDVAWEAKKEQEEKERIAKLFLTGADVERGIYQAKGLDFEDIVILVQERQAELVSASENNKTLNQVQGDEFNIDIKALKIELKANNFYRGNPYVSAIGAILGFSEEQLDLFFEDGNYEHLLPVEEPTETLSEESIEEVFELE